MKAMERIRAFDGVDRNEMLAGDHVIERDSDTADGEGEYHALDIEARPLREIEETWGIPVNRNVNGFGKSE